MKNTLLFLIWSFSLILLVGCSEEPADHTVHPRGVGFQLPQRGCVLEDPSLPDGVPGTCTLWERNPPEPADQNNWNGNWNNGSWNNTNNINNINNTNNINNFNNTNNTNNFNNTNNTNNDTGDPEAATRAMEEADLIRIDGDLLYTLSAHRGLLVIDLADPAAPRLLGSHPLGGVPFEMHVREGVALVQYAQFWRYVYDESSGEGRFQLWSRVVALDVADPTAIRALGDFPVPGEIGDSRWIGDILYLVSGQTGGCAGCTMDHGISVLALDVSDPAAPREAGRLELPVPDAAALERRPVHFSQSRLYVGGLPVDADRSRIQVVDISDPAGALVAGAQVTVAGQITNRWQMDEHEGVLRVVGQSLDWDFAPVVTTFELRSSADLLKLDELRLQMREPEQLRSVRFDGPTAYLITMLPPRPELDEWMVEDPLFIVDCSDPADLVQQGEFEMPGWVYFIEPRPGRLITLGFDNDIGATLTLSLFDVSNPWLPRELERIPFGWSTVMAEDQSRIHKAMQVLDDRGLILVPYGVPAGSVEQGAVEVFSFSADSLERLSSIPLAGVARRTFLKDDTLVAVGSEQIATYDLADPAQPVAVGALDLVHPVFVIEVVNDELLAVLNENPWTGKVDLEVYDLQDTRLESPLAVVDLEALGLVFGVSQQNLWNRTIGFSHLFSSGRILHILHRRSASGWWDQDTGLASFDLTDPTAPRLLRTTLLSGSVMESSARRPVQTSVEAGENAVFVQGHLVFRTMTTTGFTGLFAVDLRDPINPNPRYWNRAPSGQFVTNLGTLFVSGDHVYSSTFHPSAERGMNDTGDWVDYTLVDLDLSDPDAPTLHADLRIHGSLVGLTPSRDVLFTVDYGREQILTASEEDCLASSVHPVYDPFTRLCHRITHTLRVSPMDAPWDGLIREYPMGDAWIRDVQTTQTRLFYTTYREPVYEGFPLTAPVGSLLRRPRLNVISLQGNDAYDVTAVVELPHPYAFLYWAHGNHAVVVADAPPVLMHLRNPHPDHFEQASETALGGYLFDLAQTSTGTWFALGTQGLRVTPAAE